MKKIILGLTFLTSISSFASTCLKNQPNLDDANYLLKISVELAEIVPNPMTSIEDTNRLYGDSAMFLQAGYAYQLPSAGFVSLNQVDLCNKIDLLKKEGVLKH